MSNFDFNTFGTKTDQTTQGSFDFNSFGTNAGPAETTPYRSPFQRIGAGEPLFPAQPDGSAVGNFGRYVGNIPGSAYNLTRAAIAPVNPLDIESPINIGSNLVGIYDTSKELLAQNDGSVLKTTAAVTKSVLEDIPVLAKKGFNLWKQMGESIYKRLEQNVVAEDSVTKGVLTTGGEGLSRVAEYVINDPALVPTLLYAPGRILKGEQITEDTITKLARPVIKPVEQALESRRVGNTAKDILTVEKQYADTRKAMDFSDDANAGSRDRIARSGVLRGAVDESGVILTSGKTGPAATYRAMTIGNVEGVVRDMLEVEGLSVGLGQLRKALWDEISTAGLEGKALRVARNNLKKEIDGLRLRGDGVSVPLTAVQNSKIATYMGIDYKSPPNVKTYAKAVARAYKKTIEKTSKLNVAEVNKVLSKYEKDIDLLESLDGKRVAGGKLGKYFAQIGGQVTGAVIGATIGGIPGSVAGGFIGGGVANTLKSRSMQRTFGYPGKPLPKEPALEKAKAYVQSKSPEAREKKNRNKNSDKNVIDDTIPEKGVIGKLLESIKQSAKNPSLGLAVSDITKAAPTDEAVRVGLSPVKGAVRGKYDDLVDSADALFAEGKFDEAFQKYGQIVQGAQKTIQDKFKQTNIKVKFTGVDFGVYEGVPEPTIGFSATVKPEDMDLFHTILGDISQKDFNQHSFVTYKQTRLERDTGYGIVDKERGISREPHYVFKPEKPLTLSDIQKVNAALADAELPAMSIKEGGTRIDILHLTGYDSDYGTFVNKVADFAENLDSAKIIGSHELGVSETRFVGNKGSSANTTYERSRRDFYKKNKDFVKPDSTESKVLDAIRYKGSISKKELESIARSGEISPTEKAVFREVIDELPDGKLKPVEIQQRLRGKLLTLTPTESSSYTNYGWERVLSSDYDGKAVVFDSNFKHGRGQNHYQSEGLFGHARYALTEEEGNKIATIGELQSDVFQHTNNIDHIKNFLTDEIQSANNDVVTWSRIVSENPSDTVAKERLRVIEQSRNKLLDIQAEKEPDVLREQFLNFARSNQYRQRLFEETVDYIMKTDKPDEIRVAKPSMVAKIEGYLGSGDDIAPYELRDGNFGRGADDLTYGDEVGYLGEPYTVVDVQAQGRGWGGPPPTMIGIVPEDKVNKFRLSEYIDDTVKSNMDELEYALKKNGIYQESDVLSKEALQSISDEAPWPVSLMADRYLTNFDNPDRKVFNKANFVEDTEELAREKIDDNAWYDLEDIYGKDHVFSDERGYDPMVYVVQDDVEVEYHGQPSSYTMDRNPLDLDESPSVMREMLPEYEGILTGYFDLHNKIIPKYEQKIGQQFTDGVMETPDYTGEMGYASFSPDYSRQSPPKKTF